jgi:hypothetical protein
LEKLDVKINVALAHSIEAELFLGELSSIVAHSLAKRCVR